MKRFVLNVLVFSAVFAAAEGIKCYNCSGTEDDCAKDKLEADKAKYLLTCSSSYDRCVRLLTKKDNTTAVAVASACSRKSLCYHTKKVCDDFVGWCNLSCCAIDECNAHSAATDGLKCYVCTGTDDDCAKDKLEADKAKYLITCPSSYDRCMRILAKKDNITSVASTCYSQAMCDVAKKLCDNYTEGQCDFSCCATDECNAVSAGETTDGIKCYDCVGTEDDCAKDKLEADKAKYLMTCSSSYDRCIRVWAKKDNNTSVENSCSSKAICDTARKACDNFTDGQCDVSCCQTDECNAGSVADGIKCYNCLGTKHACAKGKLEGDKATYVKTCPKQLDRCMLYWTKEDDQDVAMSSCADKALCDDKQKACKDSSVCGVSCCFTDECNVDSSVSSVTGGSVTISGFVMTVCSIVGLALFNQSLP